MYVSNFKILNSSNLISNFNFIKKSNKVICAMVKANAYGHGLKEIVNILKNQCNWFGVANSSEALLVKKYAKQSNILVVGKSQKFDQLVKNNISISIDTTQELIEILKSCKKYNKNADIHIAINTGMNRIGVKDIGEYIKILNYIDSHNDFLCLKGIFTHCYDADCKNSHFYNQMKCFYNYYKLISDRNVQVHIGGSYVLKKYKIPQFINMIRVGYSLYGYGSKCYKPVMSINSSIIKIINCKKGEYVGYGNKTLLNCDKKIAIIPVGYADGISRRLSNKYSFTINEQDAKIIGYVCMDMCMLDITNIQCKIGDTVKLLLDAKKLASALDTSPYEILTAFQSFRGKSLIV